MHVLFRDHIANNKHLLYTRSRFPSQGKRRNPHVGGTFVVIRSSGRDASDARVDESQISVCVFKSTRSQAWDSRKTAHAGRSGLPRRGETKYKRKGRKGRDRKVLSFLKAPSIRNPREPKRTQGNRPSFSSCFLLYFADPGPGDHPPWSPPTTESMDICMKEMKGHWLAKQVDARFGNFWVLCDCQHFGICVIVNAGKEIAVGYTF